MITFRDYIHPGFPAAVINGKIVPLAAAAPQLAESGMRLSAGAETSANGR